MSCGHTHTHLHPSKHSANRVLVVHLYILNSSFTQYNTQALLRLPSSSVLEHCVKCSNITHVHSLCVCFPLTLLQKPGAKIVGVIGVDWAAQSHFSLDYKVLTPPTAIQMQFRTHLTLNSEVGPGLFKTDVVVLFSLNI